MLPMLPSELKLIEASEAALMGAAGYLAGKADKQFGTGTQWTMLVYMATEGRIPKRPIDLEYLRRLESSIAKRWPEGERPPRIEDWFRGPGRATVLP